MPVSIYLKGISALILTLVFLSYVFKKTNSKKHRLFPVINILAILYNCFDLIFSYREWPFDDGLYDYLEKLFLVVIIYLLFIYLLDFLKVKGVFVWELLSVVLAFLAGGGLYLQNKTGQRIILPFHVYVTVMAVLFFGIGTFCFVKYSLSRQELLSGVLLYFMFFFANTGYCRWKNWTT